MAYCRKCGYHLDDFDSYCPSCGAKVEYSASHSRTSSNDNTYKETKQSARTTITDSINDFTESASKKFEALVCFICGIASLTFGTFICAIVSLVFGKKAIEKGQDKDETGAMFCKVGKICSKISIVMSIIGLISLIIYGIVMAIFWI